MLEQMLEAGSGNGVDLVNETIPRSWAEEVNWMRGT